MRTKIKRNDPCPCGSGKKHKKCCGQNKRAGALPPRRRRFGIPILTGAERDGMRAAGKANATLLDLVRERDRLRREAEAALDALKGLIERNFDEDDGG